MIQAAEHVLQSTICAALALLLAWTLSRAAARIRHTIWVLASLKFLLPLSLLVSAGHYLGGLAGSGDGGEASVALRWLDRSWTAWNGSFEARFPLSHASGTSWPLVLGSIWIVGSSVAAYRRWSAWRDVAALVRRATPLTAGREARLLQQVVGNGRRLWRRSRQLRIVEGASATEPGVFGVRTPILVWPEGLSARLTDDELEGVLMHEALHVERRDNLVAVIHSCVEVLFWFNPVVWWLGHRLIAEREQACDEEVANMSIHRRSYAQALIKVCGFCLTPSRPYVAGVQSSELSRRITRILTPPSPVVPTWAARLLLVPAAAAVLAAPLAAGAMRPLQTPGTGAAAQEQSRPVYSPGPGITWPKLVKESKPNYTQSAMQAKLQGVLTLEAIVEADGAVKEARVVKSLDKQHGLDDQAIKAVKEWVFEPGTRDGKPVAVRVQIEMSFTLK